MPAAAWLEILDFAIRIFAACLSGTFKCLFLIILLITLKRSMLIAIIPFAGVSLMYDIMNPIGFILEVPAELQMRRKQRKKR